MYEAGDELADGTTAAGRRTWFGAYDETLYFFTADGWTLFDAAVLWTAG